MSCSIAIHLHHRIKMTFYWTSATIITVLSSSYFLLTDVTELVAWPTILTVHGLGLHLSLLLAANGDADASDHGSENGFLQDRGHRATDYPQQVQQALWSCACPVSVQTDRPSASSTASSELSRPDHQDHARLTRSTGSAPPPSSSHYSYS